MARLIKATGVVSTRSGQTATSLPFLDRPPAKSTSLDKAGKVRWTRHRLLPARPRRERSKPGETVMRINDVNPAASGERRPGQGLWSLPDPAGRDHGACQDRGRADHGARRAGGRPPRRIFDKQRGSRHVSGRRREEGAAGGILSISPRSRFGRVLGAVAAAFTATTVVEPGLPMIPEARVAEPADEKASPSWPRVSPQKRG